MLTESLRDTEFARLDTTGTVYLDFAAAALYPASLVTRDLARLTQSVLGNPHSESAPSLASTDAMARARRLTLHLLDASPTDYDVVFTSNASSAIRVLAEAFPFGRDSRLVLTADNHNSVNGLRVAARRRGAAVHYVPLARDLRARHPRPGLRSAKGPSLFAFPAQSNFSGVRHPLEWIGEAQARGYRVLVDAAAYLPTQVLSLRQAPADFVALSFYKLFGYPTGVGALVARRDALASLRRGYFGGGTVQFVSVQNRAARAKPDGERFEDGTPNFLAMPAIGDGLEWLQAIGMDVIACHTARRTGDLLDRLAAFGPRIAIYGPRDTDDRGGTVAFNVVRNGRAIDYERVETAARERAIAVRGGCFCNPGAAEAAFAIPPTRAKACLRGPFNATRLRDCLDGRPTGAVRASVGVPTSTADLDHLTACLESMT